MKRVRMNKKKQLETFNNRVVINDTEKKTETLPCGNCGERLVFALKNEKGETFSIGLRTIIACLAIAEKENAIPKILSDEWWIAAKQI